MFSKIKKFVRKYKISTKKLFYILILSIIEVFIILIGNGWVLNAAVLAPLVQFIAVLKSRDGFDKLSKVEKNEHSLSEDDLDNFIYAIAEKLVYMTVEEILKEIKKD